MRLEDIGLIGNCQISAHVDRRGAIVWCCMPRFDSEPVFASLLDEDGGSFLIEPASSAPGTQRYIENTNILETRFEDESGSFRVLDFAPRFIQYDRSFRPAKIVRIVEPLSGAPRIRVRCDPRLGWSKAKPRVELGSNHISFLGFPAELRLTTDVPLSYLEGSHSFALTTRRHFVLAWGAPVEEPLAPLCDRFQRETRTYWQRWVKHCEIPPTLQSEVIRSALALKLHCFEDTGAIVAATTTSIPEAPGSKRNWDYRYCWLRDAYYVLDALRLLGHFEEREQFLEYILNVAGSVKNLELAPLYRIDGRSDLSELELAEWAGFEGHSPVRVGNGAALHQQNDVFGETILALAPMFLDERFRHEQTAAALGLVTGLARKAIGLCGVPDAGIWELRTEWTPQTFSSLMSWAAADRMALVAKRHAPSLEGEFKDAAVRIRAEILEKAWSEQTGAFASSYGGSSLDASLLQAAPLRFLPRDHPKLVGTIDAIARDLIHDGWLLRYRYDDSFGVPEVAFVICTFWLVEALAVIGRRDQAQELLAQTLSAMSPLGLLAEDWSPGAGRLWGNFPQAYSHVGLIHAAFASAPRWGEVM